MFISNPFTWPIVVVALCIVVLVLRVKFAKYIDSDKENDDDLDRFI